MLPYHAGFSIGFGLSPPLIFFSPRTNQNLWKTLLEGDKLAENAKKWGENSKKGPKRAKREKCSPFGGWDKAHSGGFLVIFGLSGVASAPLRKTLPCI